MCQTSVARIWLYAAAQYHRFFKLPFPKLHKLQCSTRHYGNAHWRRHTRNCDCEKQIEKWKVFALQKVDKLPPAAKLSAEVPKELCGDTD